MATNSTIASPTIVTEEAQQTTKGVKHYLEPVVTELTALSINGKQAHWHVRGANFLPIHEYLDTLVDHARDWADEVAERVIALGLPVDGRIASVANTTAQPPLPAGFQSSEETIQSILAGIDTTLAAVDAAIEGLDDIDLPSQDIVNGVENGLRKDRWFLASHLLDA